MTSPVPVLLFGPVPGGMEMIVILAIAVLLFGADRIPKLAHATGEALGEFKKGRQELESELAAIEDGETPSTPEASASETSEASASETSDASASESNE